MRTTGSPDALFPEIIRLNPGILNQDTTIVVETNTMGMDSETHFSIVASVRHQGRVLLPISRAHRAHNTHHCTGTARTHTFAKKTAAKKTLVTTRLIRHTVARVRRRDGDPSQRTLPHISSQTCRSAPSNHAAALHGYGARHNRVEVTLPRVVLRTLMSIRPNTSPLNRG